MPCKLTHSACALAFLAGCGGGGTVDADYACLGHETTPVRGDLHTTTYEVRSPSDEIPFSGATVHVFADGVVTEGCDAPCEVVTANDEGLVDVSVPSGWFAYRVLGEPEGTADRRTTTIEVGAVHPPDDEGFLNALWADSMRAIFSFAKGRPDPGLGKAVVRGVDCTMAPVANLHPRVFAEDGTELDDVVVAYLNRGGGFPGIGRLGTNVDGRAFLANLPEGKVRVELWGRRGDGPDKPLSCEIVPIEAGTTTTARLRPLRADADPSCSAEAVEEL